MTGPSWKAAFPEASPDQRPKPSRKRLELRLRRLRKSPRPKGEYASATVQRPGQRAEKVLSEELGKEIGGLSWPKTMYWRPNKPERFVRPLRWLLCLLDENVVPLEFAGIRAGNLSYGHRVSTETGRSSLLAREITSQPSRRLLCWPRLACAGIVSVKLLTL